MRVAALLLLSSVALIARSADDLETLDEEFLAYLAEFESDDDDWTIVETPPTATSKAVEAATPSRASPQPRSTVQPSRPQSKSGTPQSAKPGSPPPDKGSTR